MKHIFAMLQNCYSFIKCIYTCVSIYSYIKYPKRWVVVCYIATYIRLTLPGYVRSAFRVPQSTAQLQLQCSCTLPLPSQSRPFPHCSRLTVPFVHLKKWSHRSGCGYVWTPCCSGQAGTCSRTPALAAISSRASVQSHDSESSQSKLITHTSDFYT